MPLTSWGEKAGHWLAIAPPGGSRRSTELNEHWVRTRDALVGQETFPPPL